MSVQESLIRKIEQEEADVKRLGINVRYLCFCSACKHHNYLLGKLLTIEEIKVVYFSSEFPDDCRCAISQILVDTHGNRIHAGIVDKVKNTTLKNSISEKFIGNNP